MAKSKIEWKWDTDYLDRSVLVVAKKRGKLAWAEVLEALYDSGKFNGRVFLLDIPVNSELPMDLYDEGDVWLLYQPDDYLGKDSAERLRPKKPADDKCPNCGADIKKGNRDYIFCPDCGQEIYWD